MGAALAMRRVPLSGAVDRRDGTETRSLGRSSAGREVLIEVVGPPDLSIAATVATGSPYLMRARGF
jgi:hypothetical protein